MFASFMITFIAGMSTMIGSLLIFLNVPEKKINKLITSCLSFSMVIMIGISVLELIPESFFSLIRNYGVEKASIFAILPIILGFLIIIFLTKYMDKFVNQDLYKLGILSMIALIIHNLPEGIAVFSSSLANESLGLKLALAIAMHNIPEGICISVPIYYATQSRFKAFGYSFISALAEPIGGIITYLFFKNYINTNFVNIILLFVGSLMFTLSINDIFPKARDYNEKKYFGLGFCIGLLMLLISIILK